MDLNEDAAAGGGAGASSLLQGLDLRRASARLVAALTRVVGPARLDLAEDAAQDALLRALKAWPVGGPPADPEAWLVAAARNALVDRLRREAGGARAARELESRFAGAEAPAADAAAAARDEPVRDDDLRLLFLCAHPDLAPEAAVALALKECCGFGVPEIAAAFLLPEPTVAQRLVRARRRLRDCGATFELPDARTAPRRLEAVLDALYLLFNEGWRASSGEALTRREPMLEALRLVRELAASRAGDAPATHALAALMLFTAARLPARTDAAGDVVSLADQDRGAWDRGLLAEGFARFERSMGGDVVTRFHVEASIASLHAMAPSFEAVDWGAVVDRYDHLLELAPTPVVRLNRAVAVGMARGAAAGLAAWEEAARDPALERYAYVPAAQAFLLECAGDDAGAAAAWRDAATLGVNGAERAYARRRAERAARRAGADGEGPAP
ncbi:MAG TPA: sigma-70 family RNA polymerase sigma factor [Planctomycetota bacterium]|nr:sigma-70 family RNA polymerase sigma factor [Planctomycetota bacterium]